MKIRDLFRNEDLIYSQGINDTELNLKITANINSIDDNTIYFHLKKVGERKYEFPEFSQKTPYATVCEMDITGDVGNYPIIKVKNIRKTLAYAYSNENNLDFSELKIIGITGTNGKSSTSEMLYSILREAGNSVGYIGTGKIRINDTVISDSNYSMTTPDPDILYATIAKMKKELCDYIIMEVSSHALALYKTAPIQFECGIFTNLTGEHMDFHSGMEDYYKTKLSMFENCKMGIFNFDDDYSKRAYNEVNINKYSVGILNKADTYITDLKYNGIYGSSFFYREKKLIFKLSIKLGGYFNVYNSVMAAKCAIALGIKPCIVKKALGNLATISGRLERIESDITVIIDYAHTSYAFENILKTMNFSKKSEQSLTVVFGCGGNRDKGKRAEMGELAERLADKIIITEDNSRTESFDSIKDDILSGMARPEKSTVIKSRSEAIKYAIMSASENDLVAIVGKGDEKYLIDKDGYHPFSERSVIRKALEERRSMNAH